MPIATLVTILTQAPGAIMALLPVFQQVQAWVEGGKTTVTSADFDLLVKLGQKTSAQYLADAGGAPVVPKV